MKLYAAAKRVGFSLTKWYLDVVAEDGSVAIAYWAEVRWRHLRQPLCGVLLHPAGRGAAPWRFSGRHVEPPQPDAAGLRWGAEPLGLRLEYLRREPAYEHRLLHTGKGVVDWSCEIPRGEVWLRAGDVVLEGTGYAERIELSLPPWRIPADEIRWGRFLADGTSVVWIDWRGELPQQLVFHDGRLARSATISEEGVQSGEGLHLRLDEARAVSDDRLGGLLAPLETLRPVIEPITRTHQTRWLSRGELHRPGCPPVRGWALHEMVRRR
jgi:hypothetical protein